MATTGITIRGLDELKKELARLDAAVQNRLGRNAVMAMARVVAKHARANAPVDTGALRASIKARRDPRPLTRGQAVAFANAKDWKAHLLEYGTVKSAAHPFMRPALDEHVSEVQQKLVENLSRGIDRELKKQRVAEDLGEQ